jgi:SPP1 gp7 family putative phage head morphogenesis protein
VPSRTRQRRWNGQRFEQLTKAVNPNFEAMARAGGDGIQPRAFPLLDAINAATGEITANGGVYGQFQAMPRDPRDDNAFGPMDPLRPEAIDLLDSDGRTEPRSMVYPVGWNLPGNGNRETPWAVLRAASVGVGIIRRCIEARKKDICDLELRFGPSEDAINDAYQANPGAGRLDAEQKLREELLPDINRLREFWLRPWRSKSWGFKQWCRAALEDIPTIDALPIYPRRTYGGEVYDLELIDGTTIKPLLDVRGNPPLPPFPALQQILYGFPRGEWAATVEYDDEGNAVLKNGYQSSEMMYYVANPRTFSPFGFSPVEQCLFDSRLYLQRQKWMLAEYDDGSTPLTWVETAAPTDGQQMTLTQQRLWEKAFNAKLAGNTRERARVKVLPNGWKAMQMTSVDERYRPEYDLYLIKLLCGHFGLTATRLGFGESNGLGGSGFSESQMAVTGELGLKPDTEVLTEVINQASCHFLGMDKRIKAIFVDPSESNTSEQATITDTQVKGGQISINEARQKTGQSLLPFEEANKPFILGGPNGIIFLEGAQASIDAAMAAQQMQAETAALGTAGKLTLEEEKLKDGKEAREAEHELARETRDVTLEAQRETAIKKAAEVKAFRTWRSKPSNAGDAPRRPFLFKSVEPDDIEPLGPLVAAFEGWEWQSDEDITKAAKRAGKSPFDYIEWNLRNPAHPKGPNGRWVKVGGPLHQALVEEGERRAKVEAPKTGEPSGESTTLQGMKPTDKPKVPKREGKAKRGDLIVIEQKHPDFKGRTEYPVFQITSVTREGTPRMMQELGWQSAPLAVDRFLGLDMQRSQVIPAEEMDVDAIKAKLKAHTYPNSNTPRTYEDLKALRDEVLLPHVRTGAEDLARARQARIDAVKPKAEFLAEIEEALINQTDSAALRRMVEQSVRRNNLADDPVAGHVQLNMDQNSLNTAAAAWGLRRIGDEGSFDPALHRPVGDRPRAGGDVELVRPGYVFRDGDQDIQLMHAVVDARASEPERPAIAPSALVNIDEEIEGAERYAARMRREMEMAGKGRKAGAPGRYVEDVINADERVKRLKKRRELAKRETSQDPALDKPGIDSAGFVTSAMNAHSLGRGDRVVIQGVPASVVGTSRHNAVVTLTLDDGRVLNLGLNEPVRRVHGGNLRKAAVPDDGPGDADPKAEAATAAATETPSTPSDTRWPGWLLDIAIAGIVAGAILETMPGLPIGELVSLFKRLARDWPKDLPTWREMDPQARRGTVERVLWELRQDGWPVRMADVLRDPILGAHLEGHFVGQQVGQAVADATLDGLDITSPDAALRLSINWSDWVPGHPEAARLLIEPGGLERLLRESNVVINRLAAGRLDQIGRIIGEGLANGLSPREIAGRLQALVNDPDWAMMTAVTETNRAMSAASVMQYREAGLLFKGWMTAFDQRVCKICDHNAHREDGTPRIVPIDELFPSGDPWPPGHPRCRCAPIPVLNSMVPTPPAREAQT